MAAAVLRSRSFILVMSLSTYENGTVLLSSNLEPKLVLIKLSPLLVGDSPVNLTGLLMWYL